MSEHGNTILKWWGSALGRETAQGRALSARLRRATPVEVMCEPRVHDLACELGIKDAERLVRLVSLLAEVREHVSQPLAKNLGSGDPKPFSTLRFQKLMRATGDELVSGMRRAIKIAGHRCNVAVLGEDLMFWSEQTRMTWCFHYFGADAPKPISGEKVE
ncbi:type I-E CRISPR-associated protein Cse2/CasB [Thalassospira sp.]|uniref:type I-E CRISPR-associated protein Cse2/CasB n=1 Tax=Thalassospira sp. TaxID=1912094 RepID=UPI002735EDCD|nr:type I-E CRISPR-associated protein Cse2/CasB [Thalassospira sp.]MDP2699916.1 type I-E CRISPR-associated protein Cse2/CasB [Thalassospira sp.]